jgi:hypothetical protein
MIELAYGCLTVSLGALIMLVVVIVKRRVY